MTLVVYPLKSSLTISRGGDGSLTIYGPNPIVLSPEDTEALREYLNRAV